MEAKSRHGQSCWLGRKASIPTNKYIEDIQVFGVNMSFILLSEVKIFIFHECRRHE